MSYTGMKRVRKGVHSDWIRVIDRDVNMLVEGNAVKH